MELGDPEKAGHEHGGHACYRPAFPEEPAEETGALRMIMDNTEVPKEGETAQAISLEDRLKIETQSGEWQVPVRVVKPKAAKAQQSKAAVSVVYIEDVINNNSDSCTERVFTTQVFPTGGAQSGPNILLESAAQSYAGKWETLLSSAVEIRGAEGPPIALEQRVRKAKQMSKAKVFRAKACKRGFSLEPKHESGTLDLVDCTYDVDQGAKRSQCDCDRSECQGSAPGKEAKKDHGDEAETEDVHREQPEVKKLESTSQGTPFGFSGAPFGCRGGSEMIDISVPDEDGVPQLGASEDKDPSTENGPQSGMVENDEEGESSEVDWFETVNKEAKNRCKHKSGTLGVQVSHMQVCHN